MIYSYVTPVKLLIIMYLVLWLNKHFNYVCKIFQGNYQYLIYPTWVFVYLVQTSFVIIM